MGYLADAEERLEAALQKSRDELERLAPLTSRPIHARGNEMWNCDCGYCFRCANPDLWEPPEPEPDPDRLRDERRERGVEND